MLALSLPSTSEMGYWGNLVEHETLHLSLEEATEECRKSRLYNYLYRITAASEVSTKPHGHAGYEPEHGLLIGGLDIAGRCHEFAHWLLADDERKSLADFGLGRGYNSYKDTERVVSAEDAMAEEAHCCNLEILLLYNMMKARRLSPRLMLSVFRYSMKENAFNDTDLNSFFNGEIQETINWEQFGNVRKHLSIKV